MKTIPLTQGKFAIVDDEDFERVSQFKWYAQRRSSGQFHAARKISLRGRKPKMQYMHVFLLGTPPELDTLHANGDGLDNRRSSNLRVGTHIENMRGRWCPMINNVTGYRGVSLCKQTGRLRAGLQHLGRWVHVGRFDDPKEAALARDAKARELGWPESGMNFPV